MRSIVPRYGFVLVSACLLCLTTSRSASAVEILDDPEHYTQLSAAAMQTANSLCWELHRHHQQQPDFTILYRDAKEIWSQAANLNNALQAGPVDAVTATQQIARMSALVANVEKGIAKWGDGVRPTPPDVIERRPVVVTPGVGVNIPFFGGIRIGAPRVAIAEDVVVPTPANRRAMHPNGLGSRRKLDREMAAVKTAVGYLVEDVALPALIVQPPTPVQTNEAPAPAATPIPGPPNPVPLPAVPNSDVPDATVPETTAKPEEGTVLKVNPASAKKTEPPTAKK